MSPRFVHPSAIATALLMLAACGSSTGPAGGGDPPPIRTELPRSLSPSELRIVEGANAFTFDLAREAARGLPSDSNLVLSPLSASLALAMALNGAEGETWTAMSDALRLDGLPESEINRGFRDLTGLLRGLDARTEMRIANSMWGDHSLTLLPPFMEAGRTYFDAEVAALDFSSPEATTAINGWVSEATDGRIPKLLEQISSDEVLFLINAIYFKGTWRTAFDRRETREAPFRAANGQAHPTPMMILKDELRYADSDTWQAVDLLYGSGAFAMTVLLPVGDRTPEQLVAELDAARWAELTVRFEERPVQLALPRFRVEYARRLNDDLAALGMGIAFSDQADFSRIADPARERLAISRVDRPFVFAIRERLSGAVLFLGVMNVVGGSAPQRRAASRNESAT